MNKKKSKKLWIIFLAIIILLFVSGVVLIFLSVFSDSFRYRNAVKIRDKEDMYQFFYDNEEELETIVTDMRELYDSRDEYIIMLRKDYSKLETTYPKIESVNFFLENYSINYVSIDREGDLQSIEVTLSFNMAPKGYTYWGIYYTSVDQPNGFGNDVGLVEENGVYTQLGTYFEYETEKIIDHWYFYQCNAY